MKQRLLTLGKCSAKRSEVVELVDEPDGEGDLVRDKAPSSAAAAPFSACNALTYALCNPPPR